MEVNHREMREKVDDFIKYVSNRPVHHFYLETISMFTKMPVESFAEYLFQLVEWKEIDLSYEIKCDEYECNSRTTFDSYEEIPFGDYITDYRGHEILVDNDSIIPVFKVPEKLKSAGEYKEKKLMMSSILKIK